MQVIRLILFKSHYVLCYNIFLNDLFVWDIASLMQLPLIYSFYEEASELVPLHKAIAINVDLLEQRAKAMHQIRLFLRLIRYHTSHEFDKLDEFEAILILFLFLQELCLEHLELIDVKHLHDVVNGELVEDLARFALQVILYHLLLHLAVPRQVLAFLGDSKHFELKASRKAGHQRVVPLGLTLVVDLFHHIRVEVSCSVHNAR